MAYATAVVAEVILKTILSVGGPRAREALDKSMGSPPPCVADQESSPTIKKDIAWS